jgi:YbgC/YbaW family acyl-CoA thioester hydrolase
MEKIEVSKYAPSNSLYLNSLPIYNRTIHVYETDKDGVVHFSNYFKIAEEALYSGLQHFGFSFENNGYSMAMINTQAHYIHPIKFAEQLNVVIAEIKLKRSKLLFTLDFNNRHLVNLAKIQLTFVLIDTQKRKAIPVPEQLKFSLSQTIINHEKGLID